MRHAKHILILFICIFIDTTDETHCYLRTSIQVKELKLRHNSYLFWSNGLEVSMKVIKSEEKINSSGVVAQNHEHTYEIKNVELPMEGTVSYFDRLSAKYIHTREKPSDEPSAQNTLEYNEDIMDTEDSKLVFNRKGYFSSEYQDIKLRAGLKNEPISCFVKLPFYESLSLANKKRKIINNTSTDKPESNVLILQFKRASITQTPKKFVRKPKKENMADAFKSKVVNQISERDTSLVENATNYKRESRSIPRSKITTEQDNKNNDSDKNLLFEDLKRDLKITIDDIENKGQETDSLVEELMKEIRETI